MKRFEHEYGTGRSWESTNLYLVLLVASVCMLLFCVSSFMPTATSILCSKNVCIKRLMERAPMFQDELTLRVIRSNFFDPPSPGPLNMKRTAEPQDDQHMRMRNFVNLYFNNKTDGRFLVIGAGDGEYKDLTIDLEREKGWTGLLVEPNPFLYKILKSKRRNAELSSACVLPYRFPVQTKFVLPLQNVTNSSEEEQILLHRQMTYVKWNKLEGPVSSIPVQCLPLETVFKASSVIGNSLDLLLIDAPGITRENLFAIALDFAPKIEVVMTVNHTISDGLHITKLI